MSLSLCLFLSLYFSDVQGKAAVVKVCEIANVLFPKGYSCAGTKAAIAELERLVTKAAKLIGHLMDSTAPVFPKLSGSVTFLWEWGDGVCLPGHSRDVVALSS